jgi:hypothetical protein
MRGVQVFEGSGQPLAALRRGLPRASRASLALEYFVGWVNIDGQLYNETHHITFECAMREVSVLLQDGKIERGWKGTVRRGLRTQHKAILANLRDIRIRVAADGVADHGAPIMDQDLMIDGRRWTIGVKMVWAVTP